MALTIVINLEASPGGNGQPREQLVPKQPGNEDYQTYEGDYGEEP